MLFGDGTGFVHCLISALCIRGTGTLKYFARESFALWLGD